MSKHDGILSIDQIAEIRGVSPEGMAACAKHAILDCKRCKDSARKRKERAAAAEAKNAKALKAETEEVTSIKEFWALNIQAADPTKLAAWREQQEKVFDQIWYVEQNVQGTYYDSSDPDYVDPEQGDEILKEFIAEFGKFDGSAILQSGKFWLNPNRMSSYKRFNTPESIFARYGITVGVPTQYVHDWEDFIRKYRLQNQPKTPTEVLVSCATCKAATYVDPTTAKAYTTAGVPYRCDPCSSHAEPVTLDDWGRVKDQ